MSTDNNPIDSAALLNDLREKRAALDMAITYLMQAFGTGNSSLTSADGILMAKVAPSNSPLEPTELPRGAFLGKSLPAAVKLYLSAVRKKQTVREITNALKEGGVETTSPNFEGVITGCLHRMKASGELLRFKDGWSLAEFYPESLRSRLGQDAAPKKRATKSKKTKKAATPKGGVAPAPGEGLEHRIEEYVRGRQGAWFTSAEIAQALPNIEPKSLPLAVGRLAKKHGWQKDNGKYCAAPNKVQEMPKAV